MKKTVVPKTHIVVSVILSSICATVDLITGPNYGVSMCPTCKIVPANLFTGHTTQHRAVAVLFCIVQ